MTEDAICIGGVDLAHLDTYASNALRCVPEAPPERTRECDGFTS